MRLAKEAHDAVARAEEASREAISGDDAALKKLRNAQLAAAYETAEETVEQVRQAKETLTQEVVKREERRSRRVRVIVLAFLLLGWEISLLAFRPWFDVWQYLVLLVVSLGTAALAVAVYQTTRKFSWFAVVAFLAAAAFQGGCSDSLRDHFAPDG